jgi:N-methylhydantoinase A/oxoprolinase/acetone carboxylase beta subunit/N-methylhydantoinase B/oxoprolinase/acetone carboxylase alpha subunit
LDELMTEGRAARIAVDIGGTFTDVVIEHNGILTSAKVPTTQESPEIGFLEGVRVALDRAGLNPSDIAVVIHGTTLATNALIERKGAKTALITNEGFRDSIEIGYEARFDQYDLNLEKPVPVVTRELRLTVRGRLNHRGEVLTPLDENGVRSLIPVLKGSGVEALAIGFLHAYANPDHERRSRLILQQAMPDLAITLSSEVCPELREYERLTTATVNAYVQPLMSRYLMALGAVLESEGFTAPLYMVTSAGGMTDLETATRFPIRLVESGPSGGAILSKRTAEVLGERKVLSYDMGGTTAKICLIDDFEPNTARTFEAGRSQRFAKGSGLPLRIPVVDMMEIGAGGGSIAHLDAMKRLSIGPESAGALPGPACYDKGGNRPTVTDADLVLGRVDPERFAEGQLMLNVGKARSAIDRDVGTTMGLGTARAAYGISEMVDEAMANAARIHAAEHGKDLRARTLIAFGGAGPLHAVHLAQKLGIRRVVVPANPSVGSAVGFLHAPISYETVRSLYMDLSSFDVEAANRVLGELETEAYEIVRLGAPSEKLIQRRTVLMRYVGQGHEIAISLPEGRLETNTPNRLRQTYESVYVQSFGRALPDCKIEILTWALFVSTVPHVAERLQSFRDEDAAAEPMMSRQVWDSDIGKFAEIPVFWRPHLKPGMRIRGSALIVEPQTTTVLPRNFVCKVDVANNLIVEAVQVEPTEASIRSIRIDRVHVQTMWSRLQSVVDEQAGALMRAAFSPIVRESGDISAGIFDVQGRMLAQAVTGTPGHVNSMAEACEKFFTFFPPNSMRPGDIYLSNDPWMISGHLNDFLLVKPCFHRDRLIGFALSTSHLVDIGGKCLGPDGSDVYDEGLYIPPLKLLDEGRLNETLMVLLKANSRMPQLAEGDVFALMACSHVAERRLSEMMEEFGIVDLEVLAEHIIEASGAATRLCIRELPDGIYEHEMTVDGYDFEVTLKARLTIERDELTLDLYESSGLSRFGINVPLNYARAYTCFGLKCAIAPNIPNNYGSLLPLKVTAPFGTIVNAPKPAPVCSRHIIGQLLPDVAFGCLHKVMPGRVPAEGASTLWDLPLKSLFSTSTNRRGETFATELVFNGGTGARPTKDGLSATAYPSGVMGSLVEVTENVTPLLIGRREFRAGSGGPGKFRGGLGQVIEVESTEGTPLLLYGTVDRIKHPARGRENGRPGLAGRINSSDGRSFDGKGTFEIPPGVKIIVQTPGGGGFGNAFSRDPSLVALDVLKGLILPEAARTDYGVILTPDGDVDEQTTRNYRSRRNAARL